MDTLELALDQQILFNEVLWISIDTDVEIETIYCVLDYFIATQCGDESEEERLGGFLSIKTRDHVWGCRNPYYWMWLGSLKIEIIDQINARRDQ